MTTEINIILAAITGAILGMYVVYTHYRIKQLENIVDELTTMEAISKKNLTTKIPLSELPPEVVQKLAGMMTNTTPLSNSKPKEDIRSYTG